ncbi:hypothetical protein KUV23_04780 [Algoriphagus marincola]|uniref:Uncharacterized protein n=1 Tax=Algoriphagus marincola TaxID=264027 RepID=A0ABS7N1V4_9BACT|nr:hypothetical protein [Algoriphagus marincola]MBY5950274.1 hypothetical protein [Algoriphagus marincola]
MKQLFGISRMVAFSIFNRIGKSKCGTVWNVALRNEITGYSCCAVLKVGKWNEERMKCTYRRHMAVGGITLLI